MVNSDHSAAFTRLKPLCNEVLKKCSAENITKLEESVKELNPESVQTLQEYIIFPFQTHLNINTKLNEKVIIKCIEFFTLVFKKSSIDNWQFFDTHFAQMIKKLCDLKDMSKSIIARSEELKFCICENILWLVRCSSADILKEMYSLSFRPKLAHVFFVFNTLLSLEKSKTLIKAVLTTIGALAYSENYLGKRFSVVEQIASEALACCLPGIAMALRKVICNNDKQGYSVISMALSILTDLIILVVGDESFNRGIANDSSSDIYCFAYKCGKYANSLEPIDSIPIVLKDATWFKSVSEKLEILLKNITVLSCHNHWNVRLKYLQCIKSLLFKCTITLENCIPILLPSIFGLSVDNNESISSSAKCLLTSFSELLENENFTSLKSVIDDNVEKSITDLIKHKYTFNDNNKLAALKSLLGYIEISGTSFSKSSSVINLERIVLTLITLLEFDISDSSIVEELPNTVVENFDTVSPVFLKKKFKFFKSEDILTAVCQLCYSLGCTGNPQLLIDYLLEKLITNDVYTLQCIFIIGSIIKGLSNELNASHKYSTLLSNVLEVFLSSTLFNVPTHRIDYLNLEGKAQGFPVEEEIPDNVLYKNKIQICLLLEAIAHCSEYLRTEFKLQLMKVLCPVIEKAASSNFIVSQCGKLCLYYISKSCDYKSIQELIKDNADYITNILLINFHQYMYKPEMAAVLHTVINECDAEGIFLFRDLIFKILDVIDYNQDKAYPFMVVLKSVIVYIRKWFPCIIHYSHCSMTVNNTCNSLRTLVLDYILIKKSDIKPQDFNEEYSKNISDTVCEDDHSKEDNKANIPLHINIICDIFKRCIVLQSTENKYLRMLILETVELCILALRGFENELLPLVHEFWSPFLQRFTEDTFISKAFNVLLTIANECGDFIRQRSFNDVMPKIVLFLQKELNKSQLKCNFKHYQWTNDHSLQILVLSEIGNFCTKLDISEKELNAIVNACLPYLEKAQPEILQNAAVKSLKALATVNSDSVYFYWNVLYCEEKILIPPSKNLLELSFPYSNNSLTSCVIEF